MPKVRKPFVVLAVVAWALLGLTLVATLALARADRGEAGRAVDLDGPLAPMFAVEPFELVSADGGAFRSANLAGRPWVAMIFLTRCPTGACPAMVGRMEDLLAAVGESGVEVVSMTADPAVDTPERLAEYAKVIGADPDQWHFVTGTPEQVATAGRSLKMVVGPPHDERFLLVDGRGVARGIYSRSSDEEMAALARDARALAAE